MKDIKKGYFNPNNLEYLCTSLKKFIIQEKKKIINIDFQNRNKNVCSNYETSVGSRL